MPRLDTRIITLNGHVIAIVVFLLAILSTLLFIQKNAPLNDDSYGAWILKDWLAEGRNCQIVILGDSQLGGLRAADAKQAGRTLDFVLDHRSYQLEAALASANPAFVFVSAQPGCLISDYYAILRALIDRSQSSRKRPRLVILTVSPRVFLTNGLSYPGESDYYRYFSTVTNLEETAALAYPSFVDRMVENLKSRIAKPRLSVKRSQFVFLPNDMQVYQERQLIPRDLRVDRASTEHQIRFLQKTIEFLKMKEINCLVVLMPVASGSTQKQYRGMSAELCKKLTTLSSSEDFSFTSLDNGKLFKTEDFLDSIHLSQKGGETFARTIADYLKGSDLLNPLTRRDKRTQ